MQKQPILLVKDLSKQFGNFTAVKNLSFTINEGEIVGVLGPNGAGKTTTIQMLLGVLTPTKGQIEYFGLDITKHREEILERVNFSTTYTNLPWLISVKESLTFISYLYDIKHRKERVDSLIEDFKLQDFAKKSIASLSAGQRTRVNLAKAFINKPKVLLLDEPTASMDPDIATYLRELILDRKQKEDMSIIWTSHNMSEVEEMCDRVIFINHGKVIADDTPKRLAGTIEMCHVELLIKDGLKRTIEYSEKRKFDYHLDGLRIVIDVKEKHLAEFLRDLGDKGIHYDEISIQKPTLEDYFLQTAKKI